MEWTGGGDVATGAWTAGWTGAWLGAGALVDLCGITTGAARAAAFVADTDDGTRDEGVDVATLGVSPASALAASEGEMT